MPSESAAEATSFQVGLNIFSSIQRFAIIPCVSFLWFYPTSDWDPNESNAAGALLFAALRLRLT